MALIAVDRTLAETEYIDQTDQKLETNQKYTVFVIIWEGKKTIYDNNYVRFYFSCEMCSWNVSLLGRFWNVENLSINIHL